MMDMEVLLACQLLLEQVFNEGNSSLLQQLYHHLLFDFRIWTKSHFAVSLGRPPPVPRPPQSTNAPVILFTTVRAICIPFMCI